MLTVQSVPHLRRRMEYYMITVLKWVLGALVAGLLWLVAGYTDEYLRPYKKIRTGLRRK
jgi:hypothetical protein